MPHTAVLHPRRELGTQNLIYRTVEDLYVAVYPQAGAVFGQQQMRVHLGIAGQQRRVGDAAVEFHYLPYPYPVGGLLALPDEAHELELRIGRGRLAARVIGTDYAGIYHALFHFFGILNIEPIIMSAASGSKGMKPPQW